MIARSVGEVLEKHVTLDIEGIDRLYLNAYQPLLQMPGGVVRRGVLGLSGPLSSETPVHSTVRDEERVDGCLA